LTTQAGSIEAGREYHFAMTFGDDGAKLYLDGRLTAWNTQFTDGLENNTQAMAIGASTWSRTSDCPHRTGDYLDGRIDGFTIYDVQYDANEIGALINDPGGPAGEEDPGNGGVDADAPTPGLFGNLAQAARTLLGV
jgi:hypothetical protein